MRGQASEMEWVPAMVQQESVVVVVAAVVRIRQVVDQVVVEVVAMQLLVALSLA